MSHLAAQAFHTLYHTDESVLLGAPTGSGKTISAELAMLRAWRAHPGGKVIYIAPLKVPGLAPGEEGLFSGGYWYYIGKLQTLSSPAHVHCRDGSPPLYPMLRCTQPLSMLDLFHR